ncbi:MAG: cytochrome C oxidase subunit IV family protein [Methylococcales bacterium]|nr:cytochrome C oxidase subunit IV family protein [Methylococcales bacterium]
MKPISGENHPVIATYLTGFVLALLLTLLAFGLVIVGRVCSLGLIDKALCIFPCGEVITGTMPRNLIIVGVIVLAILQISVHLGYFLHLSFGSPQNWNLQAFLFALFIIIIMVGGTLWIMNDLNGHMLPGSPVGAAYK